MAARAQEDDVSFFRQARFSCLESETMCRDIRARGRDELVLLLLYLPSN